MTKKIIAALLAAAMLIPALVSCDKGAAKKPPVNGTGNSAQTSSGSTTTKPTEPAETEPEVYAPDPDCPYAGYVGFGTSAGNSYFDDFEVVNKGKQGSIKYLIERATFEKDAAVPKFTSFDSGDEQTAEAIADPVDKKKKNHAIEVSDTTFMSGDPTWNFYRYNVKVLPEDETTVIDIYFCVKDKDNYYVLSLGEENNTEANCYEVKDGQKTNAQFKYPYSHNLKSWTPISINVDQDYIIIYINGNMGFSINNPEFFNNYAPYEGEELPGSISVGKLGAPSTGSESENIDWLRVDPEKVIHDGKGTWSNDVSALPTMAFDNNPNTYYDCDAKKETVNSEAMNVGIPGDESFPTGYVGVQLDTSVTIRYIRYAMRKENPSRYAGCYIEASVDGSTWVRITDITETSAGNEYHTIKIPETITVGENQTVENSFKYIRFVAGDGDSMYCNVAELEIWVENK